MFNQLIESAVKNSLQNKREGDFYDESGLLMCGKCKNRKQMKIEFPKGNERIVGIMCDCEKEEERLYNERIKREKEESYINSLYKRGLTDKAYLKNTFEKDNKNNPEISALCRKYVEHWDKMKENSAGILFYGALGGGKSFYACCIANALLKRGVRVLVTRLSDLVKNHTDDNVKTVNLKSFELIVLDDLGVENDSQTAFNIADEIYRMNIPVIVTTNLTPADIKNPSALEKRRIYDRILERCCITRFVRVNKSRLNNAKDNKERIMKLLTD